jgi:hypothetical protein
MIAPCRSMSPDEIVAQLLKSFGKDSIERVWLFPIDSSEECPWSKMPAESNCKYLVDLLNTFKKNGLKTGICALDYYWFLIFGDVAACPEVATELLAWFPLDE